MRDFKSLQEEVGIYVMEYTADLTEFDFMREEKRNVLLLLNDQHECQSSGKL